MQRQCFCAHKHTFLFLLIAAAMVSGYRYLHKNKKKGLIKWSVSKTRLVQTKCKIILEFFVSRMIQLYSKVTTPRPAPV